jgi:hypothetical protein
MMYLRYIMVGCLKISELIFFKLAFEVRYSITALGLLFGNVLKQGILTD